MQVPKKPDTGSVVVIRNSGIGEFDPEVAKVCENYRAGVEWVEEQLDESPGDLYVVCRIESLWFANIQIENQTPSRSRKRWLRGQKYVR